MNREKMMPFYNKTNKVDPFELYFDFNKNINKDEMELFNRINDTEVNFPIINFNQMFADAVHRYGDEIAIRYDNQYITFNELDDLSNRIATYLFNSGVHTGDSILFSSERCLEMIVSIIGIIKTGAIYVPIDCNIPEMRLNLIAKECNAKYFFKTDNRVRINFDSIKKLIYNVSEPSNMKALSQIEITKDMPMYIIFTSGTTGVPKGVVITHENFVNFCNNNRFNVFGNYCNPSKKNMLSVTSITFDIFMMESLGALVNGYSVLVADEVKKINWEKLKEQIEKYNIEAVQTTPSIMRIFLKKDKEFNFLNFFSHILLGGEPCEQDIIRQIKNVSQAKVINCYGPTETTVFSTYYTVESNNILSEIPVGLPIANTKIYIINNLGCRCKIGEEGEICIAGKGVFSSYTDLSLKQNKMIYIPDIASYAYKTGDIGLIKDDGFIYCRGRLDHQVKINGNRIELNEIKNVILALYNLDYLNVKVEIINSHKVICAYYVWNKEIDKSEIIAYLKKRLPQVMIPLYWIKLESIELNENGKFYAQKALTNLINPKEDYLTLLEKDVYEAILKVTGLSIGREANLLDSGIDSLNFILIMLELEGKGYKFPYSDFYTYNTISSIADHLEDHAISNIKILKAKEDIYTYFEDKPNDESLLLSATIRYDKNFKKCSVQKKETGDKFSLKYLSRMDRASHIMINIPLGVDLNQIIEKLRMVVEKSPSFRTAYFQKSNIVAELSMPPKMKFEVLDKKQISRNDLINAFYRMCNPSQNDACEYKMLSNFTIIRDKNSYKILLIIHHILWDQVSAGIYINLVEQTFLLGEKAPYTGSLLSYLGRLPNKYENKRLNLYLDRFEEKARKFTKYLSGKYANEYYSEIELDNEKLNLIVRDPLRASTLLQFLMIKMENPQLSDVDEIPMFIAVNNRNQDNMNIIAEMADHIPISFRKDYCGCDIHKQLEKVMDIRHNRFVRFERQYDNLIKQFVPINNLSLAEWDTDSFCTKTTCSVWASKLSKATQRYRWSFMPQNGLLVIKANSFCNTSDEFVNHLSSALNQLDYHSQFYSKLRIEQAKIEHYNAITDIYVDAFTRREKVTMALGTSEKVAKWYCKNYIAEYISKGYVNVAIDCEKEKVVGFTLVIPDNVTIYLGKDTQALFDLCREGLFFDKKYNYNGLHNIFVGVDRDYIGRGVHLMLAKYNIEIAKQKGYKYLFAECTSVQSANGLLKVGYKKQYAIRYCDSKIQSLADLDGECVLMVKTL